MDLPPTPFHLAMPGFAAPGVPPGTDDGPVLGQLMVSIDLSDIRFS